MAAVPIATDDVVHNSSAPESSQCSDAKTPTAEQKVRASCDASCCSHQGLQSLVNMLDCHARYICKSAVPILASAAAHIKAYEAATSSSPALTRVAGLQERQGAGLLQHGCKHYRRRCKLVAPCCGEVFWCRHCHNEVKAANEWVSSRRQPHASACLCFRVCWSGHLVS